MGSTPIGGFCFRRSSLYLLFFSPPLLLSCSSSLLLFISSSPSLSPSIRVFSPPLLPSSSSSLLLVFSRAEEEKMKETKRRSEKERPAARRGVAVWSGAPQVFGEGN
jgi:hypothetical protein